MKFFLLFALALLCLAPPVFAEDAAVKKYKNYTPEQIRSLSAKERDSSVPMMYTMAANRGLAFDAKLAMSIDLNTLMYSGMSDYDKAVKDFQSDLGEKPTGVLTVWQIYSLQQRADAQKLSTVGFPDTYSSFITDDDAEINGTATMLNEKIAWPINHVKIRCHKTEMYCTLDQIVLQLPDEKSWAQIYEVMDTGTEWYKITRWDKDIIDAVPMEDKETCRTSSWSFNFKLKEFFETVRNGNGDCNFLGKTFPKLSKPTMTQIINGKKIMQEEFINLHKKTYGFLASDFRKRVDAVERDKK